MASKPSSELDPVVQRLIQTAGSTSQSLGMGRVVGQIYAYLFFSSEPRCLDEIQSALGVSKGSVSMGVRQLEQWAAAHKVWVKGDRKDYYEADDWLGRIVKNVMFDMVGKKIASFDALFADVEAEIETNPAANGNGELIRDRIQHLRRFYDRARKTWDSPIVRTLMQ